MREIVLDTETTGMDPSSGDRIVEIGCVELINHVPTGKNLHMYLNPERDVPAEAVAIHGLTAEFLSKHPTFAEVVDQFVNFIGDDMLVIHNADFDVKFLNAELRSLGFPLIQMKRVTDTVLMARRKFPGSPANLDALCRRFGINLSERTLHGALLDSELLAEVYLELLGGRQHGMSFEAETAQVSVEQTSIQITETIVRPPRAHAPLPEEMAAHLAMIDKLANALWKKTA